MRKLNNKGYLLIEIIVAIVLAMGIAYFLMNLTIKFSKRDEDVYQSISWTNDKNVLTNMIMNDVEKYTLTGIKYLDVEDGIEEVEFTYYNSFYSYFAEENDEDEYITKKLTISKTDHTISYGDDYLKKIDSSLQIGEISIDNGERCIDVANSCMIIKIPMTSVYSNEDYGIKLFVRYLEPV